MARVIVLGGTGFIGRNFVQYLVENNLASKIRVADKVLPALAGLSAAQKAIFESDKVEFKQVNLSRQAMVQKVFDDADGKWDYVFNLAGETKYSQADAVYQENIIDVTTTTAKAAAEKGVKKFVEVSTAQVYDAGDKPRKEDARIKPWTGIAKAKAKAEEELKKISGLHYVVVRPAVVYGPGDLTGITPRLVIGAIYKTIGEKMEFLWDKDLSINTVHVRDVARALWHLAEKGASGSVYNLADESKTDQGEINKLIESIYGIKTSFLGNLKSKLATSVSMKTVAEHANDKHLKPWSDLCKKASITTTPLTPYLDEELLYDNPLSVDGNAIKSTGFSYTVPKVTEELLREAISYFTQNGTFPAKAVGL